jgi:transcriptional regulator with XRE-family HTH domain
MISFADKLNLLFDTAYPPGQGPFRSAEVLDSLRRTGVTMSAPYLSQLRSGNRSMPSGQTIHDLAAFFRVDPAYFTDDRRYAEISDELRCIEQARTQWRESRSSSTETVI